MLLALTLLWAVACFSFFAVAYPHHLFYQEQMQLFVPSADYLVTYFDKPAWLACMAGDFVTQAFYYLYAGPALLTLALLALGHLTRRTLERVGTPRTVAHVVALAVMTLEAVGYLHNEARLSGTLALLGGLAMFLIDCHLTGPTPRLRRSLFALAQFALLGLTYWLFGCGVIPFALFLIYRYYRVEVALAVVSCAALILLLKSTYYLPTADLFRYPGHARLQGPETLLEEDFAVADLYFFHREDELTARVETRPDSLVTRQQQFYYYLVKARQGALPEALLRFSSPYLGTLDEAGPETPLLTLRRLPDLYWALGDMTLAERAAMQALVFTPDNRNVRMIRRLAEVNLVTGQQAAADKYLRLLAATPVYHRWAEALLQRQERAMAPYRQKAAFTNQKDTLRVTAQSHVMMMQLLDSNPDNYVARDYMLCTDLLLCDVTSFYRDYQRYCVEAHRPTAHRLYQEALCIYLAAHQATEEEWLQAGMDNAVLRDFAAYNERRGSPQFKGTYWYYFDRKRRK
jgi:hypothetical protein